GSFDYAGVKARFKARLPHRVANRVGLAVNTELSAIPRAYSESRFGMEVRPIADLWTDHFYASINPIIDIDYEGSVAGPPQLEPAAKAALLLASGYVGIGGEYYSALGPITDPLPASREVHRLLAALDLQDLPLGDVRFGANAGIGYGLAAGE